MTIFGVLLSITSVGAVRYPLSSSLLPGNVNFDPLGLSSIDLTLHAVTSPSPRDAMDILNDYGEAEIKHARLAMLGAVAYPLQETVNPILSEALNLPNMLAPYDLSPSLLNGGLQVAPLLYFLGIGSALELSRMNEGNTESKTEAMVGDYKWRFTAATPDSQEFYTLREGEIWNGRIAMIAMLGYIVQESVTHVPVLKVLV